MVFRKTEFTDQWVIPNELPYHSSNADQSHLAYDQSTAITLMRACAYVAQYGPYVVHFRISWTLDYSMDLANLEKILQAIDKKMR